MEDLAGLCILERSIGRADPQSSFKALKPYDRMTDLFVCIVDGGRILRKEDRAIGEGRIARYAGIVPVI